MSSDKKAKLAFAPIPIRAIGDKRLTTTHWRILAAIAFHDRISGPREKGAGCFASNKTLADKAQINYSNFSTAVNELGRWGYVEAAPHPLSKRTRVYRVLYEALPVGKQSAPLNSLPVGEQSGRNTTGEALPVGKKTADMVCPPNSQAHEIADFSYDNIFSETVIDSAKQEESSVETAPIKIGAGLQSDKYRRNVGAYLARLETSLKANGETLDDDERDYIEALADSFDRTDPLHNQALRLIDLWSEPS